MLECVPNVSEGRDVGVIERLARACGTSLLDVHRDVDHHRSVFTLAAPQVDDVVSGVHGLARMVATTVDVRAHDGVHPRLGALDVVPFITLDGQPMREAIRAARDFAKWTGETLHMPVFLYGEADDRRRTLPETRAAAFRSRAPDYGPGAPDPRLGAVAVGARAPMIAVNCALACDDIALARAIARDVRERDGGLPGVRALGFELASRRCTQVSMNLIDLDRTGLQPACESVRDRARASGCDVAEIELVGLMPAAELERCDPAFRAWAGLSAEQTIEARVAARRLDGFRC